MFRINAFFFPLTVASLLLINLPVTAAPSPSQPKAGATLEQLHVQYPINWISIEQIAASLKGKPPMDVGFDIDDTLLYSTPAFFHGKQQFSPDSNDYLKNDAFWEAVSNGWDAFSVPKQSARNLIKLHMARHDRIWFITGRPMPKSGRERVTDQIAKDFAIAPQQLNPVIFAGVDEAAKVKHIKAHRIAIFYGDSDNDIEDARAAGAEGIRVLRPTNSSNQPMPVNGALGEKVLVNSDY